MTERTKVALPIWHQSRRYDAHLTFVDVPLRVVAPEDAPVAVEWCERRVRAADLVHEYLEYDGALWKRILSVGATSPSFMRDLAAATVEYGHPDNHIVEMARYGGLQQRDVVNSAFAKSITHASDWRSEEARIALAHAPHVEDRVIVVDDELWVRSDGPVIGIKWHSETMRHPMFEISPRQEAISYIDRACLTLSAVDMAESRAAMTAVYGKFSIEGEEPVVLADHLPPTDQVMFAALERTLWHFLWEARNAPAESSRRIVELMVEARRVLVDRWPGIDLDLHPRMHAQISPHLHGRMVPPPTDIRPVLARIVEAAEGVYKPAMVANWRLGLVRAERWIAAQDAKNSLSTLEI